MSENFHYYIVIWEDGFSAGVWHLLRDFMLVNCTHPMATHSNTIAWKISWMEEPGRLQSMELQRV